jgi:hypothetical protein
MSSSDICRNNWQKTLSIFFTHNGAIITPVVLKKSTPGVDVMITIFGDFRQFLAKKLAFFSITNVMIKVLHNLALF